jgi:hypothetical protein
MKTHILIADQPLCRSRGFSAWVSCCFCIFAPRSALLLAGRHNPELLAEYVEVERRIGHTFRLELPLASIQQALTAGEEPGPVHDWLM